MAEEQVYNRIPDKISPYKGESTELKAIFDDVSRSLKMIKIDLTKNVIRGNGNAKNHINNADGTLADITTKFNILLSTLEDLGLLKKK